LQAVINKTLSGNLTVYGNLTISTGTLVVGNNTLTLNGNLANNSVTGYTTGSGSITLTPLSATSVQAHDISSSASGNPFGN